MANRPVFPALTTCSFKKPSPCVMVKTRIKTLLFTFRINNPKPVFQRPYNFRARRFLTTTLPIPMPRWNVSNSLKTSQPVSLLNMPTPVGSQLIRPYWPPTTALTRPIRNRPLVALSPLTASSMPGPHRPLSIASLLKSLLPRQLQLTLLMLSDRRKMSDY